MSETIKGIKKKVVHEVTRSESGRIASVVDAQGRKLTLRVLQPTDELDVYEACGRNSSNNAWLNTAMMLCKVAFIGETPVVFPRKPEAVKELSAKLGREGVDALVAVSLAEADDEEAEDANATAEAAKN